MAGSRPSSFSFFLSSSGPMRLYSTTELLAMPPPEWLIEGVLPVGGLCCLYGQPGIGKSFISMDMALSVATGRSWLNHPLQTGYVLYVAAEGGPGIAKRAKAWLTSRGVEPKQTSIAWMIEPMSVYRGSDDVGRLMGRLESEIQEAPRLIVIDTLARCFDGDENKQQDMGAFVAGVDQLRHEYGATVLVVHHTRLDGDRERGNTAFRGGVDTMIKVERDGKNYDALITLECTKQKDAEGFEPKEMWLKKVPNTDSCVVVSSKAGKPQRISDVLEILVRAESLSYKEWLGLSVAVGISPATFKRYILSLKEKGEIVKENGEYRLS